MMKKLLTLLMSTAHLFRAQSTVRADAGNYAEGEVHTIGVVAYDPDSAEMEMFADYYRDYIQEGFPVKFIFSGKVADAEAEKAFIAEAKAEGAEGIISFAGYANGLQDVVETCEKEKIYYALGSNTVSDENYEAIKDNPWYIGSVGPDLETVYNAGCDMTDFFLDKGAENIVIMSGGAASGNRLHQVRTWGMLNTLEEKAGLVLTKDAEELSKTEEVTELSDKDGKLHVTICPGYTEMDGSGLTNLETVFASGDYDTLMSAFHVATYLDRISDKEKEQDGNIMIGAIDSFSEQNFEIFQEKDQFGNVPIDYVRGKYASMAGPVFAMIYNAITGNADAVEESGEAVRLYQNLWTAKSEEEYIELYGYATGIYENAYSCDDLMQVIRQFNEEATPQGFKELTEASDVESVKERIFAK